MRVVSLGSGSSGNSFLVEAGPQGRTKLLLDAGLSARTLITRLASVGVTLPQLQGVLVTHEHSDHVRGIPTLIKRYHLPVIADVRTLAAIQEGLTTGVWQTDSGKFVPVRTKTELATLVLPRESLATTAPTPMLLANPAVPFAAQVPVIVLDHSVFPAHDFPLGTRRTIGDIEVTSFAISHDAIAPAGYLLQAGGCRVCLVTDSGEVTAAMLEYMQHADLLILESNHDRERLRRGPYPWSLKQRILSSTGHLSNDQAAVALLRIWREGGMRWLWLAHLSRTNNTPEIAQESMHAYLHKAHANLAHIRIAPLPHTLGPIWDSTHLWR